MATKTEETQEKQPAPIQHNKEYDEYKLDVTTAMKKVAGGGEALNYHLCELGKKIKSVFVEPKRADILNRAFESRKILYWPADKPKPEAIKRISAEDEQGNPIWKDEYIMAK